MERRRKKRVPRKGGGTKNGRHALRSGANSEGFSYRFRKRTEPMPAGGGFFRGLRLLLFDVCMQHFRAGAVSFTLRLRLKPVQSSGRGARHPHPSRRCRATLPLLGEGTTNAVVWITGGLVSVTPHEGAWTGGRDSPPLACHPERRATPVVEPAGRCIANASGSPRGAARHKGGQTAWRGGTKNGRYGIRERVLRFLLVPKQQPRMWPAATFSFAYAF